MCDTQNTAIALKDYLPLIGVVVGGVLALVGGFASNLFIETRRNADESKKLAFAFKGELLALSYIVKKRGYVVSLKLMIETMEKTNQPLIVHIKVSREYFNVFNANVNKIGSLKNPLPELIARFYVQANAVLEDLESLRNGDWSNSSVEALIGGKKELVSLMEETFSLADEIVVKIEEVYPS
jgi:hypothetical protein